VPEGQDRMAFGAIESCLAPLLPMLAGTIEVVAVERQGPVTPRDRSTAQLRGRGRRYGSFAPGARHRLRLVPGYSVAAPLRSS
jgi:hypothetical protein